MDIRISRDSSGHFSRFSPMSKAVVVGFKQQRHSFIVSILCLFLLNLVCVLSGGWVFIYWTNLSALLGLSGVTGEGAGGHLSPSAGLRGAHFGGKDLFC